jgi:hypothetical protein
LAAICRVPRAGLGPVGRGILRAAIGNILIIMVLS